MGRPDHPVDGLHHMNWNPDGSGLIGNGPGNGLPNPPGGVGGELVALGIVELVNRLQKAQIALLHQIQQLHAPAHIALGDGNHQTQICLGHLLLGLLVALRHSPGDLQLLLLAQQGNLSDFLEVHPDRVVHPDGVGVQRRFLLRRVHQRRFLQILKLRLRGQVVPFFQRRIQNFQHVRHVNLHAVLLQQVVDLLRLGLRGVHGVQNLNQSFGGDLSGFFALCQQFRQLFLIFFAQMHRCQLFHCFFHGSTSISLFVPEPVLPVSDGVLSLLQGVFIFLPDHPGALSHGLLGNQQVIVR